MRIGVPNETTVSQTLVAATPDSVAKLTALGYDVVIESGAGNKAYYPDEAYVKNGATITDSDGVWSSDIVVALGVPSDGHLDFMKPGSTLISRLSPANNASLLEAMASRNIVAIAMDAVPRISRAQSLDVRSSMTNLAGYRAVIEAADVLERTFGGQVTAAGKINPARVYVIGVGVAGLSAIGTAVSMGAEVFASDVRPEVAEQVASLGATFVKIPVAQKSADGYARALTEDESRLVNETYACEAALADVVITTAMVEGTTPPLLLDESAIAAMKPGSVIVDLGTSPNGGNTSLTRYNETYITEGGVTIVGKANLAATMAEQASQLYGQNIVNFLKLVTPNKDGILTLDERDEIVRAMTVTLDGRIMWPPPPVNVSVATDNLPSEKSDTSPNINSNANGASLDNFAKSYDSYSESSNSNAIKNIARIILFVLGFALTSLLLFNSSTEDKPHIAVFILATIIGFLVIRGVSHSLHTPLMSITNAISGIIIVGAFASMSIFSSANGWVFAIVAILLCSINIFGGFKVTKRMLEMFDKSNFQ